MYDETNSHAHNGTNSEARDTLLIAGGVALIALGAGLILAHPGIRRSVMASLAPLLPQPQGPIRDGIGGLLPDVERYMRIKGM
jgi:hypothetical protein